MSGPMVTIPMDQFLALVDAQSPERRAALRISVRIEAEPVRFPLVDSRSIDLFTPSLDTPAPPGFGRWHYEGRSGGRS